MSTPDQPLSEMMLRAETVVPPIKLSDGPSYNKTPNLPLPRAAMPVTSVPMRLPATTLAFVPVPTSETPALVLPEITSPAAGRRAADRVVRGAIVDDDTRCRWRSRPCR